jgi:hypothetical protein
MGQMLRKGGAAYAVQTAIQMEIDRYPDRFSGPISLLDLTKGGPAWKLPGDCK